MNYTQVDSINVNEAAPLLYMIHIKRGEARDLFVGAAARGADLPRRGQLWAAQALLKGKSPYPDWFYRCDRVHFAMAEAWLLGNPIKLALIGNTMLRDLENERANLEVLLGANLNAQMPEEKNAFAVRLRLLRFKALDHVTGAEDPARFRAQAPHLWEVACDTYADTKGVSVEQAAEMLMRRS
ncbi:hypothetical protein ROLI_036580 [Roseobacter fucihabitans]|uniref:Uncharacterized protein n=1 Tax=Roseobacter fucihabitans TaxID=1537242 RepID=A0ABZ2BZE2_9RHOB|nr:hypothetical protein [Roseobacter litoralis]MBC6966312.1 hypothetical protein [Roseobacter litoralis]